MASISMLSMEDQIGLENQLAAFLQKSESNWTAIVDKGGNLFVQSGDTGDLDLSILCALAAGSFAATHELAKRLGETDFSALFQEGKGMSILMMALEHECLLIVVFGQQTNIGLVRFYAQQLTAVMNQSLSAAYESSMSAEPLQVDGGDFEDSGRSVFS